MFRVCQTARQVPHLMQRALLPGFTLFNNNYRNYASIDLVQSKKWNHAGVDHTGISKITFSMTSKINNTISGEVTRDKIPFWAESPDVMVDVYTKRAKLYNQGALIEDGYTGFIAVAEYMKGKVGVDARVLEMGVGTGLLGIELQRVGYRHVDSVDPCAAMLEEIPGQGVYERKIVDFMGSNRLEIENNTYDIVTGCGCFAPAHVSFESFEEIQRILKPDGYFFLVQSDRYYGDEHNGYNLNLDRRIADFIERGLWARISRDKIQYNEEFDAYVTMLKNN